MEVLIALLLAVMIQKVTPSNYVEDPESVHSCEVGDVIQNGRITCTCTQNYVYECIFKKPSKNKPYKRLQEKLTCHPNKIYVEDTITCICNYNGTWPHSACGDVFDSLPARNVVKSRCQPDGYVFIGCNVCRCDSEGLIDKSRCTQNNCHESVKYPERRRSSKPGNVYGNCEAKNWYSLAPCQFCFCLNENKLVCNTGNFYIKKLQLGSYNLSVCGKDLIKEAIELIPDESNSLRHGEEKTNVSTRFIESTPPPVVVDEKNDLDFETDVTHEDYQETELNEKKNNLNVKEDEESSESVHENRDYNVKTLEGSNVDTTQIIPFQEDYQLYSKESKEQTSSKNDAEQDENTDNEIEDPGLKIPINPTKDTENLPGPVTLKSLGDQLKASWPVMLDKVFQMALRKSMVTIDKDDNCVPGSINTVKCNTCFCLKNSKMLCTNNKCD